MSNKCCKLKPVEMPNLLIKVIDNELVYILDGKQKRVDLSGVIGEGGSTAPSVPLIVETQGQTIFDNVIPSGLTATTLNVNGLDVKRGFGFEVVGQDITWTSEQYELSPTDTIFIELTQ